MKSKQADLYILTNHLSHQFNGLEMDGCPERCLCTCLDMGVVHGTGSQGIHAVKSRASSLLPKFFSSHNSLGRAVSAGELDLGYSVFIVQASGTLSCVWGRLFVFILHFYSEVYDFFIRVKICQMAISDFLEIMRFWNLLKHKCQKKITAEFVWPFLFYSLMLTSLVC